VTVGNIITRMLLVYGGISIGLFYTAFNNYKARQIGLTVFFTLIGFLLIYGIFTSLSNSAIPVIDRGKIKEVRLKKLFQA
jgi:hypothetical protein